MIELELLAVLARPRQNVGNLGEKFVSFKISARSQRDLTEIQKESNFMARSLQSRRDVENLAANSTRSWQDLSNLGEMEEILLRFRNSQTSW